MLRTWIEHIIRKRNTRFTFDHAFTSRMLLELLCDQSFTILRGTRLLLLFKRPRWIMLGRQVRFQYISKISWGKFVKIDDHVFLCGLGRGKITLGNHVSIGAYSRLIISTSYHRIGSHITIGNNVGIGEYAYLGGAGGLSIGDECIIGQYFSAHPENHSYHDPVVAIRYQESSRKGIKIGNNCWIGAKVTLLDGIEIGTNCVIAAGAVVTNSMPDNAVIGGVPAKILKMRTGINNP